MRRNVVNSTLGYGRRRRQTGLFVNRHSLTGAQLFHDHDAEKLSYRAAEHHRLVITEARRGTRAIHKRLATVSDDCISSAGLSIRELEVNDERILQS